MRELTFVRPRVLEWREVPEPKLLSGSDAVVCPVAATTCDLDRSIIKGRAPYAGPIALGHEFVARIEEIGDKVRRFLPGDIVVVPVQISCGQCGPCRFYFMTWRTYE